MAKCTVCNSRKGKRKCQATATFICSLCCGESRDAGKCGDCTFFTPTSACRNYRQVPYYPLHEMQDSFELERISLPIESALCKIWEEDSKRVNDGTVARLVELMLDIYHFNDHEARIDDPVLAAGHRKIARTIAEEFSHVPAEKLVKVLATIYRSIQRRTNGGSSYLEFASRFTRID